MGVQWGQSGRWGRVRAGGGGSEGEGKMDRGKL